MKKFLEFIESVYSSEKEPVYMPPRRRADGTWSGAITVMRKTNRKIIKSGQVHDGEQDEDKNS